MFDLLAKPNRSGGLCLEGDWYLVSGIVIPKTHIVTLSPLFCNLLSPSDPPSMLCCTFRKETRNVVQPTFNSTLAFLDSYWGFIFAWREVWYTTAPTRLLAVSASSPHLLSKMHLEGQGDLAIKQVAHMIHTVIPVITSLTYLQSPLTLQAGQNALDWIARSWT